MRYKKEQDKPFYALLDAFKTVKPAEKDQIKASSSLGTHAGKEIVKSAQDLTEEKKQRQQALKQIRK